MKLKRRRMAAKLTLIIEQICTIVNLQIQALSKLKLNETEVIEQVCKQLEKDLGIVVPILRPSTILHMHEELFEVAKKHLLNLEAAKLQLISYRVDLKEEERQKSLQKFDLQEFTDLILNRCFQKVYLRNALKD